MQHALAAERGEADIYAAAGTRVMDFYRERIESRSQGLSEADKAEERLIREFQLVGVKAEREALMELGRARAIGSEGGRKLTRELDLSEARYRG